MANYKAPTTVIRLTPEFEKSFISFISNETQKATVSRMAAVNTAALQEYLSTQFIGKLNEIELTEYIRIRRQTESFRNGLDGVVLFRNVPVIANGELPDSPNNTAGAQALEAQLTLQVSMVMISFLIGAAPNKGPTHILAAGGSNPDDGIDYTQPLTYHVDDVLNQKRSEIGILGAVRGDPEAITYFLENKEVVNHLSTATKIILQDNHFELDIDHIPERDLNLSEMNNKRFAILDNQGFRFSSKVRAAANIQYEKAQAAINNLNTAIQKAQENQIGVVLEYGDVIVYRNNTVLHSRSDYNPRPGPEARWLIRYLGNFSTKM